MNKHRPKSIDALVIGASTGGPKALVTIIQSLPPNIDIPIFIVQHMPQGFTASFAKRLDGVTPIPVVEAEDRMQIEKGKVYLAPGGKHMVIDSRRIRLWDTEKIHGVKPAIDPLFEAAADAYGSRLAAVVLTGMGHDGTAGCQAVQKEDGYVAAQDEASSVVFGMPKYAMQAGVVNELLSLNEITNFVIEMVKV